jgi:hypothetical protein
MDMKRFWKSAVFWFTLAALVVAVGALISCDDGGSSPDLILRVFYKGGGLAEFDALTFERIKYYEGIEGDLCAFNDVTGEIWVARGDKVFKYDKDGRYEFGGVQLRANATDIAVNEKTGDAWVFREDGTVSLICREGTVNGRPEWNKPLPHPHNEGDTRFFLEPDNCKGGCWVIANYDLYYFYDWGGLGLHKVYAYSIKAASASAGKRGCWIGKSSGQGLTELLYVRSNGEAEKRINCLNTGKDLKYMEFVEERNQLWLVDKEEREGEQYYNLTVFAPNGELKAIAPNVVGGGVLEVNSKLQFGWYSGFTGPNIYIFAYDEKYASLYERLKLIGYGGIGTPIYAFTIKDT